MENDVRIVSFMGDQGGLCEDLYRCKETGRVFIRQECDDTHVRWLTASKWRGGYEADCHLREGLTLRVVDKSGSILFEEATFQEEGVTGTWAQKVGPFSWEPPKALAKEYEQRLDLRPYEEWKAWLMAEAKASGFAGYAENWLFAMTEHEEPEKIDKIDYLGLTAYVTVQEDLHKVGWQKAGHDVPGGEEHGRHHQGSQRREGVKWRMR